MVDKIFTLSSFNREVEEVSFDNLSPDAQVNYILKAWKPRHCKFSSNMKHSGSNLRDGRPIYSHKIKSKLNKYTFV